MAPKLKLPKPPVPPAFQPKPAPPGTKQNGGGPLESAKEAGTYRTGHPRCMQRVEMAMTWLYWSAGSTSMSSLRARR